ncbi:hypothetical protein Val02_09720 [Virgisporangium aliadipatigenens]|uniref:Uncharacterized protein n=1 Tax=Virgisporangium aliadipatigenens TaxID=741659 RepID=A0A8J3YFK4_9ACTN|nr:hypothetical protein Val02_09720 [Virgisporangium aliadipatigenens]
MSFSAAAVTTTSPRAVNFTALDSRLTTICRSRGPVKFSVCEGVAVSNFGDDVGDVGDRLVADLGAVGLSQVIADVAGSHPTRVNAAIGALRLARAANIAAGFTRHHPADFAGPCPEPRPMSSSNRTLPPTADPTDMNQSASSV